MDTLVPLSFEPIDLDAHAKVCVRFALDLHILGFGSTEGFHEADGKGAERHIAHLRTRAASWPGCLVHVWQGGRIIGQINMSRVENDPSVGYINLLYLLPEARGQGLGALLEAYAWAFLTGQGCRSLRLSASVANLSAWRFYQRNGWQDLGPREDAPGVHLFEKQPDVASAGEPVVINPDHYLETPTGRVFTLERNQQAWAQCWQKLRRELANTQGPVYLVMGVQGAGKSRWIANNVGRLGPRAIVFDAALPARVHRETLLTITREFAVPVIAIFIKAPLELALRRNARRSADQRVPEEALNNVHRLLEPPVLEEGFVWGETLEQRETTPV
ncbi:GNAT family N-acetyltransferase [Pseudomonas sp. Pseu.R1]|uniref:GNAT family N-acetyltransferase n=1 Tax=Pseudomonas sp. Pseu.R1 TaxID=3379818 RepID=UPI003B93AA89